MSFGPPPIFMFLFVTIFVVVIGAFVFTIGKGVLEWMDNDEQPVLTVSARVTAKRANVSDSPNHAHHCHSSSTTYYATFEFSSGDRKEFSVSASEYGLLAEGDAGELTFQGTRYQGFQRQANAGNPSPSATLPAAESGAAQSSTGQLVSEHSFCPYCGVQVAGDFKFCPHCGKTQPVYASERERETGPGEGDGSRES